MSIINGILNLIVEGCSGIAEIFVSIFKELLHTEKDHSYTAEFGDPEEEGLSQNSDGVQIGSVWGTSLKASMEHTIVRANALKVRANPH